MAKKFRDFRDARRASNKRRDSFDSVRDSKEERRASRVSRGMRLCSKYNLQYVLRNGRVLVITLSETETLIYLPVHGRWFISENREISGKGYQSLKQFLEDRDD